jgi:hypothetical protein
MFLQERQCTRKRQGKVREMQAWNVWTSLKNVSGSMETPYEEVVNRVRASVSHLTKASSKTGRGEGELFILLCGGEKYEGDVGWFRGTRRNQRPPGARLRGFP